MARVKISRHFKGNSFGNVWVAECAAKHLNPEYVDHLEIVDACLDAIAASRLFVLVDDGSYGTQLSSGQQTVQSSFLELELFQAVLLAKPIYYLFVGSGQEDTPLHKLMLSASVRPEISKKFPSVDAAFSQLALLLEERGGGLVSHVQRSSPTTIVALTSELTRARHGDWKNDSLFHEPQLLQGERCGPLASRVDLDAAEHYLNLANNEKQTNRVLSRTWIAIRELMNAHYLQSDDPKAERLWDTALSMWSKATAWRGLHSHLWLGNVSALGAKAALRARRDRPFFDPDLSEDDDLFNGLASVYYSISKRVSRPLRKNLLSRAQAYVEKGIETRSPEFRASLLPLRGSINMQRRHFRAAAKDYHAALLDAEKKGNATERCGFLLTELGFAELFCLSPRGGKRKMEQGLYLMSQGQASPGFMVRALRKHAIVSLANLDAEGAGQSARAALDIAQSNQLFDQVSPLLSLIAQMGSRS